GPQPIVRRDVKQGRATLERALERASVGEIALHDLDGQRPQIAAVRAAAHQYSDLPAGGTESPCNGRADETSRAGDQRLHATRAPAAAASERVAARYAR